MWQNKIVFYIVIIILLIYAVFFCSSCSGDKDQSEVIVTVDISGPSGSISKVNSITLEISASDIKTFEHNLDINTRSIKLNIPSGDDRVFTATVAINGKSYRGVSTVDIMPNEKIEVALQVEVNDYTAETVQETSSEETAEETNSEETDASTESIREEELAIAPTVVLEKIFGPEQIGDLCVYRYKAVVTGIPEPSINFNHDDSDSAWGREIAQINLNAGETFTLKVTVENIEGTAEASVDLVNECMQDETVIDEESEISDEADQQTKTFIYIGGKSGFVDSAGTVNSTGAVNAGDLDSGIYQRGYVIFDISELEGKTVESAKLIYSYDLLGSPFPSLGSLIIGRCNYDPLDISDLDVSLLQIASFSGAPSNSISNDMLKNLLQDVVNLNAGSFQLIVKFSNTTNSDPQSDQFRSSGWKFEVTYK